ncbi:MAG: SufE family protein [Bacteroidota bacterium]
MKGVQQKIVDDLKVLDDWDLRYQYIIEYPNKLISNPQVRDKESLVSGCQSQVWISSNLKEGKLNYSSDGDAEIPRGIASMLSDIFSGEKPQEVLKIDLFFLKETDIVNYLSPNRRKGVESMIIHMKKQAIKFLS